VESLRAWRAAILPKFGRSCRNTLALTGVRSFAPERFDEGGAMAKLVRRLAWSRMDGRVFGEHAACVRLDGRQ
jgi:hypothetical protein